MFNMISKISFYKGAIMGAVTIRNLPEEVHRALRVRAAEHGRSTEAEIRDILQAAVCPAERVRLGSALAGLARTTGLTNEEDASLGNVFDRAPAEPLRFE
jgi:antitoxin FitA